METYDVVVVGSGLAGLTAGFFAARYGLSTLVLEASIPGGHLTNIDKIEDFPGVSGGIAGYELCPTVQRQAADEGAQFQRVEAQGLEAQDRFWSVITPEERYRTKTVIVATGSTLKALGISGERELAGKGVSHCASCDGPLHKGQVVGVVGGGDSGLQEALTLAAHAERVIVIEREAGLSAQHAFRQRVSADARIEVRCHTVVEQIFGEDVLTGVRIRDLSTGDVSQINLSGLFIYVGLQPNTALLKNVMRLTETGHIPTDVWMKTELAGVYAVGDIRQDSAGQAITAASDGAVAAIAAYRYINETFGPVV